MRREIPENRISKTINDIATSSPEPNQSLFVFFAYIFAGLISYWNALLSPWLNTVAFESMLAFPYTIKPTQLIHFFTKSYHAIIWEPEYYPMSTFIYFLNARLFGSDAMQLRLLNFIFIISCSWLIYFLFKKMTSKTIISFLTGLLFLTHPINSAPVNVPDMNTDLFITFFSLIAFWSHIEFKFTKKRRWLIYTVFAYALALFSKETAIMLPFIFIAYDCLMLKTSAPGEKIRKFRNPEYISLLITTLIYGWILLFVINSNNINTTAEFSLSNLIISPAKNIAYALKYLLMPFFGILKITPSETVTTLTIYLSFFLYTSRRIGWRTPLFCLLWIFLAVLPVLGIIPIKELNIQLHSRNINGIWIYHRYLILPSVGFFWFIGYFFLVLSYKTITIIYSLILTSCLYISYLLSGGSSVFADRATIDRTFSALLTGKPKADYAFQSVFFYEAIFTTLINLDSKPDEITLNKIRHGLTGTFTKDQSAAIIDFFKDRDFFKNPKKIFIFFKIRKIKDPFKFWNEFVYLNNSYYPEKSIKFNKLDSN